MTGSWIMCKCNAGTLGIFLGATLARQGKKVAVVERGRLRGRAQEWNISRADMKVRLHCHP